MDGLGQVSVTGSSMRLRAVAGGARRKVRQCDPEESLNFKQLEEPNRLMYFVFFSRAELTLTKGYMYIYSHNDHNPAETHYKIQQSDRVKRCVCLSLRV